MLVALSKSLLNHWYSLKNPSGEVLPWNGGVFCNYDCTSKQMSLSVCFFMLIFVFVLVFECVCCPCVCICVWGCFKGEYVVVVWVRQRAGCDYGCALCRPVLVSHAGGDMPTTTTYHQPHIWKQTVEKSTTNATKSGVTCRGRYAHHPHITTIPANHNSMYADKKFILTLYILLQLQHE